MPLYTFEWRKKLYELLGMSEDVGRCNAEIAKLES